MKTMAQFYTATPNGNINPAKTSSFVGKTGRIMILLKKLVLVLFCVSMLIRRFMGELKKG